MKKLNFWLITTFIVATCSILYELTLAQALTAVAGNTSLRYNLTIGIYIASMGLGALVYDKMTAIKNEVNLFLKIEILLSIFGALFPWLILGNDYIFQSLDYKEILGYYSTSVQVWLNVFNYSMIVIIGLLSGIELPILMNLSKNDRPIRVLGVDYLGTMVGSVLFSLVLIPYVNLFLMAAIFSFINILIAIAVGAKYQGSRKLIGIAGLWLVLVSVLILTSPDLFPRLIEFFYLRGGM